MENEKWEMENLRILTKYCEPYEKDDRRECLSYQLHLCGILRQSVRDVLVLQNLKLEM
jgi:hypothetical protein